MWTNAHVTPEAAERKGADEYVVVSLPPIAACPFLRFQLFVIAVAGLSTPQSPIVAIVGRHANRSGAICHQQ